jgi:hypothetical protein
MCSNRRQSTCKINKNKKFWTYFIRIKIDRHSFRNEAFIVDQSLLYKIQMHEEILLLQGKHRRTCKNSKQKQYGVTHAVDLNQ